AKALAGESLPVYGDGLNIRDWLFVGDHCSAIRRVLEAGRTGETYNVGGNAERTNITVVKTICALLDQRLPLADGRKRESLITYVKDRPGHDRRYAIDSSKLQRELGWKPSQTFETGIAATVDWYLANQPWVSACWTAAIAWRGWAHEHERHHPRRRLRHAPAPDHPCGEQAAAAGVRQADDLLPAGHADAGRHLRGAGDQHPARAGDVPAPAGRRLAVGHRDQLCRAALAGR